TVHRFRQAGSLHWPTETDEANQVDELAQKLAPEFGPWLAKHPVLEDVSRLTREIANRLKDIGALDDAAAALSVKESLPLQLLHQTAEFLGVERRTFAGDVLEVLKERRTALWRERVKKINWELFDRGVEAYTWLALEEAVKSASNVALVSGASRGADA